MTQAFLAAHPSTVNGLLKGQIDANNFIHQNKSAAETAANAELTSITGKGLKPAILAASFAADHVHQRPHRVVAGRRRAARSRCRLEPAGKQPIEHLRSRSAQHATASGRGIRGEFMSMRSGRLTPPESPPGASAFPNLTIVADRAAEQAPAAVRLTEVSKVYGQGRGALLALDKVSLSVAPGEFVCLIGASGCGKSTLLSLVAGLDSPTSGQIDTAGQQVTLMFQEPALFPWLTAARNVELALRARGVPKAERRARTAGTARDRAPERLRRQAPARTLRRHAAAGGDGPGAGPGRGRAADGRAVRRAGRDDPRPAARRAGADLRRADPDRALRDAQRARGRQARRPRGGPVQQARPGHRGVRRAEGRRARGSTPARSPSSPPR